MIAIRSPQINRLPCQAVKAAGLPLPAILAARDSDNEHAVSATGEPGEATVWDGVLGLEACAR
jgi:hypothetical protein